MSIEILDCLKRKRDICIKNNNTQPKYGFHVDPRLNKLSKHFRWRRTLYFTPPPSLSELVTSDDLQKVAPLAHNGKINQNSYRCKAELIGIISYNVFFCLQYKNDNSDLKHLRRVCIRNVSPKHEELKLSVSFTSQTILLIPGVFRPPSWLICFIAWNYYRECKLQTKWKLFCHNIYIWINRRFEFRPLCVWL